MRALVVIALLFAASARAEAEQWIRADVYFRGWLSERYAAISPERLREEARRGSSRRVRIASPSELRQLLAVLDLPRLRPVRGDPGSDTYLVIDLVDSAGTRTTYRSNRFDLLTADCTRGRKVDKRFRRFFEKFTPRPNQAMQLTASKPDVHAWSVCRRERILRGMHSGLAAADLVSR